MYDESLYKILPDELIKDIGIYAGFQHVREIRLRTGRLPAAICDNGEHRGAVPVDEHMITRILSIATNYSSYAYESCMANGFLTIKGGHRIGLGGQVIWENGKVKNFLHVTFMCIRIAKQMEGCADNIMDELLKEFESDIKLAVEVERMEPLFKDEQEYHRRALEKQHCLETL